MSHRKPNLPTKICKTCGRPFTWRKSWQNNWDDVLYCSRRCRHPAARLKTGQANSIGEGV